MHFSSFQDTFQWVIKHGYPLMLLAMVVEGPIITSAASFAVAFGYFSLPVIFILSILGDVIADTVFYAIGYWGRMGVVNKFGHKFGIPPERMKRLEQHLHKHGGKTLAVIKLNPLTPMPGLMLVGAAHMPLRKFIIFNLIITIPKVIVFMVVGFYFGKIYDSLTQYFNYGLHVFVGLVIAGVIVYFLYTKLTTKISDALDR